MSSILTDIVNHFQKYFAAGIYPMLFVLSLLLIICHPAGKNERTSLFWPNILFIVLVFCPVSAYPIMYMIGSEEYWRIFWLFITPLVIAYASVILITGFSGKMLRIICTLSVIVIVAVSGEFIFTGNYFNERLNLFKIPTEAIYISDIIASHSTENEIDSPKAVVPSFLSIYIRQYNAGIRLAYGRNMVNDDADKSDLYLEVNSEEPDAGQLSCLARESGCDYLVLYTSTGIDDLLADYSFAKIGEAAGYTVYFDEESTDTAALG